MRLKLLLPGRIYIDQAVAKVSGEAEDGSFTLLPRHIDFVAALVPGLLSFETEEGKEEFLAVDAGILVKRGEEVLVSTGNAVQSSDLGRLRQTVEERFQTLDERQRKTHSALARLESDFIRRFLQIE
jgi:F-type H+-transporting ATPase subunit epsilon